MHLKHMINRAALSIVALVTLAVPSWAADPLSPSQALAQGLTYSPVQSHVEYTIPTKDEAAQCTSQPEKENQGTAWIVRNGQGQILRRFADSNSDNVVDLWCYYLDGVEVYRDIDSNFNKKADQYRWFNTAGTRWGIDKNEDGRIDTWRTISPHEVAEQVVLAIKTRDQARFNLILATPGELNEIGLGKHRADQLLATVKGAGERFGKLASDQKLISAESRYVDFGSARPATIPTGTAGSTKDVTVCDSTSALVQTAGNHEQLYLGTMISVGDAWKLVDLPSSQPLPAWIAANAAAEPNGVNAAGPTEEMRKLLDDLERLDRQADGLSPDKLAVNIQQRADLLSRLAEATQDPELRDQFFSQLADVLSVAIQTNTYPQAAARLDDLHKRLIDVGANEQLVAHAVFQQMWAQYILSQERPGADTAKIQEKWLTDLEEFVKKYPKSSDAAEALIQLGMYQEFVGKTDESRKWYQQLVSDFPSAAPASKAKGALRRLSAVGSPIQLRGPGLQGDTIDLAAAQYRGKAVLVHYWATWSDNCKSDMVLLKDIYAKKGGRDFEIVGVCLDASPAPAKQFLSENRFPWKHLYEPGGVDGRLANEMGVMTLPLMLLIDRSGRVVSNNIQVAQLEAELTRLQSPAGAAANNALRGGTTPR